MNYNEYSNDDINTSDTKINIDNLISSKKYVIKNNYWNDEHNDILISLQKSSARLTKEYQKIYLKYRNSLRLYRIPIIVMSSLSGFLSISNSGYIPQEYNKWVSLIVGFSNLMVTVISLIENFKKIDLFMNQSYNSFMNFKRLNDEITILLRIPQNERNDNGLDAIQNIFKQYQTYLADAPILKKIIKNYLDIYDDDNNLSTIKLDDDGSTINEFKETNNIENQIKNSSKNTFKFKTKKNINSSDSINTSYTYNKSTKLNTNSNSQNTSDNTNNLNNNLKDISKQLNINEILIEAVYNKPHNINELINSVNINNSTDMSSTNNNSTNNNSTNNNSTNTNNTCDINDINEINDEINDINEVQNILQIKNNII